MTVQSAMGILECDEEQALHAHELGMCDAISTEVERGLARFVGATRDVLGVAAWHYELDWATVLDGGVAGLANINVLCRGDMTAAGGLRPHVCGLVLTLDGAPLDWGRHMAGRRDQRVLEFPYFTTLTPLVLAWLPAGSVLGVKVYLASEPPAGAISPHKHVRIVADGLAFNAAGVAARLADEASAWSLAPLPLHIVTPTSGAGGHTTELVRTSRPEDLVDNPRRSELRIAPDTLATAAAGGDEEDEEDKEDEDDDSAVVVGEGGEDGDDGSLGIGVTLEEEEESELAELAATFGGGPPLPPRAADHLRRTPRSALLEADDGAGTALSAAAWALGEDYHAAASTEDDDYIVPPSLLMSLPPPPFLHPTSSLHPVSYSSAGTGAGAGAGRTSPASAVARDMQRYLHIAPRLPDEWTADAGGAGFVSPGAAATAPAMTMTMATQTTQAAWARAETAASTAHTAPKATAMAPTMAIEGEDEDEDEDAVYARESAAAAEFLGSLSTLSIQAYVRFVRRRAELQARLVAEAAEYTRQLAALQASSSPSSSPASSSSLPSASSSSPAVAAEA